MNIVNQIEIQESDGTPKGSPITGDIELQGAGIIDVSPNDDGELVISSGVSQGDDPYYSQKYKDLIEGGAVASDYDFTGWLNDAIYKYIRSINSNAGIDNLFFLLGSGVGQVGLFDDPLDPAYPGGNSGLTEYKSPPTAPEFNNNVDITTLATTPNGLHVFDMGLPDVDCEDYMIFYNYLEVVRDQLTKQKNNIESPPEDDANYGYGVFDQYIALLAYWNYLVLLLIVRSFVSEEGGIYKLEFSYHNVDVDALLANLSMEVYETISLTPIPITATVHTFRPGTRDVTVTETPTVNGADYEADELVTNTQWIIEITLDVGAVAPGTEITYEGTWTNVTYATTTSGTFTVA